MQNTTRDRHATTPRAAQDRATTRPVVVRDQSAGLRYLSRSSRPTALSTTWEDGRIYPVIEVDLSSEHRPRRPRQLTAAR